jgi:hypothetical protein
MKNEENSKVYANSLDLLFDENEDFFDDNWLVSGSDLFNDFDELETEPYK